MGGVDFLPDAGALACEERGEDSVGEHDRAYLIGDSAEDVSRGRGAGSYRVHDSGARLSEVIEGRLAAVGPVGAIAGSARVDDALVVPRQVRVPEPEPTGDPLPKLLHDPLPLSVHP